LYLLGEGRWKAARPPGPWVVGPSQVEFSVWDEFLFFVFVGTGVGIQGLTLVRQPLLLLESLCRPCFCVGFF
jgi:hypothetical protein